MVKDFTATELALLDTKPGDLDPIQKKDRERLKARQYMEKHRTKLRNSLGSEEYKKTVNKKMFDYRNSENTKYLQAVSKESTNPVEIKTINNTIQKIEKRSIATDRPKREPKPINKEKIIQTKKIVFTRKEQEDRNLIAGWMTKLMKQNPYYKINDADYVEVRKYGKTQLDSMIKGITNIMKKVENITMSQDLKSNITSVFRGMNIEEGKYKANISVFKKEMPFLDLNKIDGFINRVIDYTSSIARDQDKVSNTVKGHLQNFVNLISRIDSYHKSYQILSKFNSSLNKQYLAERGDNLVDPDDLEKITIMKEQWDYTNIERTNKLIKDANLSAHDQALASVFLLQPPRRLDHRHAVLTEEGLDQDSLDLLISKTNDTRNYLVVDGEEPVKWVYKNFKTFSKGGQAKEEVMGPQVYDVYPEVAKYLKAHIKKNIILRDEFVFGQIKDHRTRVDVGNFSNKIPEIMKKIFNVAGITATTLRTAGAIFNQQNPDRTKNERKAFSKAMAHSNETNELYNKIIPKVKKVEVKPDPEKIQEVPAVKTKPKVVLKPVLKIGNQRRNPPKKRK